MQPISAAILKGDINIKSLTWKRGSNTFSGWVKW